MSFKLIIVLFIYFLVENSSFCKQTNQFLCHTNVAEYEIDSSKIEKCIAAISILGKNTI